MKSINSAERQLGQLVTVAETLLPMSGLPDTVQQEIVGDVRGLVADIATVLPKPGAVMTFTFTTDRGYEGYSHNWGEINNVDASQPLTILEHVGGDPILMVAGRGKYSPDNYDMIAKWIGRAIYYGETIGVQFLGTKEQQFFQRVRGDLARLVKRLDTINREQLVPAFRDGQGAFVLDAKVSSKRWHELLPPTDEPLPMLEFGIVYGVSDAELVKQAAAGYFKVAQKIIDVLHEADPTTIPEFPLPAPESREFPDGTVYFYRLPKALGIDKQLSPNAGLSDDTLVLSLIPKTTVRLLRETPLVSSDLIGQHQQAAGAVVQFSLSRLLDAVSPWIGYGMTLSGEQVDDAILDQIQTGLEIASCLKEVTLVTYQADGAWVTHFETHIQDLP